MSLKEDFFKLGEEFYGRLFFMDEYIEKNKEHYSIYPSIFGFHIEKPFIMTRYKELFFHYDENDLEECFEINDWILSDDWKEQFLAKFKEIKDRYIEREQKDIEKIKIMSSEEFKLYLELDEKYRNYK